MSSRLATTLCGIPLTSPVLAASGTYGYGVELRDSVDLAAVGGIVVKGLSREPMDGNQPPRVWETEAGMINSVGLQNIGVRAFVREKLPHLRDAGTAIFANVFGYAIEEYLEVAEVLEDAEGLAGYELNVSCPNTKHGGMFFSSDPRLLAEVVAAVRKIVKKRPMMVKLSPNVASIPPLARAAEEAGADAISLVNTFVALAIDARTRKSRLGAGFHCAPHGARSRRVGPDSGRGSGRNRHWPGRCGIHDRGRQRSAGGHREFLGSRGSRSDRTGIGTIPAQGKRHRSGGSGGHAAIMRKIISTDKAPKAIGPYSQAVVAHGFAFVSGQIPLNPANGQVVEGGIREQTRRVLDNIEAILQASGSSLRQVVKTTVYLKNLEEFAVMNEVYSEFFADHPPARATVEVARLPRDVRVEIDCIATL
jgi:dihydroorotate dehydrogenase (NAD+) catalytic subunit